MGSAEGSRVDRAVAGAVPHVLNAAESPYCPGVIRVTANHTRERKNIRRTALIIAGIAVAFYLGFILVGVLRA